LGTFLLSKTRSGSRPVRKMSGVKKPDELAASAVKSWISYFVIFPIPMMGIILPSQSHYSRFSELKCLYKAIAKC
jgi:hypothetical protein